ncbi:MULTISPECIES: hypothetical protein [unclassified Mesorhizobium]|uniref:hypothetical protein n=1 Tax=unclassified Mesorhizobium TaxID=325217 RepID=UPI002415BEBD|nr:MULTISPECIES: hypothetical protein [unclassified Mesorhizobium]WFP61463.1 hypothetical protein QAZ47_23695 [Mesorhizobium sp. WSM4904]WFP74766.1 hypothetical protein QAZ22_23955 [Mesorhizobium sp. WSM4906]
MTTPSPKRFSRPSLAAMLSLNLLVCGCGPTLVSGPVEEVSAGQGGSAGCRYPAGAYALPLDLLHVEIRKTVGADRVFYAAQDITTRRTADPSRLYCLDFLGSALANDKLAISHATDTGNDATSSLLLTKIGSEFDDRSLKIANAVVDAAAQVAVRPRGAFGVPGDGNKIELVVGQFDFDPFNYEQIQKVNHALRSLDHCVFLDPTNDPYVPAWQASLCSSAAYMPPKDPSYHGLSVIKADPPPLSDKLQGVLYRPLLTHKLVIMKRNHDPVGAEWQLFQTKRVQMTNAAPAFLLQINRSLFVDRTMDIDFSNGVLQAVRIDKPSEAEALSGFVLRTMQVIVSIPVRALIVGKTDADNRKALIQAQAQMIATLEAYDQAVEKEKQRRQANSTTANSPVRSTLAVPATADPSAQTDLSACLNAAAATEDPLAKCTEILQGAGVQ